MWVKTLTKTFRVGTVVQPLFWRAIFLTQCFSSLLLQLKLIHTYLKWTITNPLVPIVLQSQFIASGLRFWKLRVFVQFPLLELFVENPNRMKTCVRAIWLFFLAETEIESSKLKKNIEVWHTAFCKWPRLVQIKVYVSVRCMSVFLLIITIGTSLRSNEATATRTSLKSEFAFFQSL